MSARLYLLTGLAGEDGEDWSRMKLDGRAVGFLWRDELGAGGMVAADC